MGFFHLCFIFLPFQKEKQNAAPYRESVFASSGPVGWTEGQPEVPTGPETEEDQEEGVQETQSHRAHHCQEKQRL